MARRSPPRKVTYFEPVPPRLARNTVIESTFEVGRHFRCTLRVDCGRARSRCGDPAGTGRMAPAHAGTPRRRGTGGLARRPQCGLSARRPDDRRAPRGRGRVGAASAASAYPLLAERGQGLGLIAERLLLSADS